VYLQKVGDCIEMKIDYYLQASVRRIKKVPKAWHPVNTAHLRTSVKEMIDVRDGIE
jgi:hypothetical protein